MNKYTFVSLFAAATAQICREYPEEHDPSGLVMDNGVIMSYFSGVELSVIDPNSNCYPQWTSEQFPSGVDDDTSTPPAATSILGSG